MTKISVSIKRVYEPIDDKDGYRILIDRLWPRGIKKETAGLDAWMKELAPSTSLRKWFNHDPEKWAAFGEAYQEELKHQKEAIKQLLDAIKKHKIVTLLYGAKDEKHNQALVLQKYLQSQLK
ncbi:DUF488 domain-containing protein [Arachidicoccus sp.]|uniref:DUF488 domain-containing protein n=1 Tax=Arachidicoccus sp. TaxID=1872624 RepID=UPI003D1D8401